MSAAAKGPASRKDLVVLVADKCIEASVQGLLGRPRDLKMRPASFDVKLGQRDAGCRTHGHEVLRPLASLYEHAMVIFDIEGCGREHKLTREEVELEVGVRLKSNGWDGDRAAVVVLDPEIEQWVWSRSSVVDRVLGWAGRTPTLWDWLIVEEWLREGEAKPRRPKEAMEAALEEVGERHSSAFFKNIARGVDFSQCVDPAFQKFRQTLTRWFPER